MSYLYNERDRVDIKVLCKHPYESCRINNMSNLDPKLSFSRRLVKFRQNIYKNMDKIDVSRNGTFNYREFKKLSIKKEHSQNIGVKEQSVFEEKVLLLKTQYFALKRNYTNMNNILQEFENLDMAFERNLNNGDSLAFDFFQDNCYKYLEILKDLIKAFMRFVDILDNENFNAMSGSRFSYIMKKTADIATCINYYGKEIESGHLFYSGEVCLKELYLF